MTTTLTEAERTYGRVGIPTTRGRWYSEASVEAIVAARLADVRALHVKVENPRHGCCAPPQLCKGHAPECRAREHPLGGVPWPCDTIRALDGQAPTQTEGNPA